MRFQKKINYVFVYKLSSPVSVEVFPKFKDYFFLM